MKEEWYLLKENEILKKLNTNTSGLTDIEAEERLRINGKNVLPKGKKKTFIEVFFSELKSPIVIILLITMVLSFIVGETLDGIFIFVVVVLVSFLVIYFLPSVKETIHQRKEKVKLQILKICIILASVKVNIKMSFLDHIFM